ncbi:hypothetical protein D3C74_290730 [compost metagenome]
MIVFGDNLAGHFARFLRGNEEVGTYEMFPQFFDVRRSVRVVQVIAECPMLFQMMDVTDHSGDFGDEADFLPWR